MTEKKSALSRKISRREMLRLTALTGVGVAAAACAAPATEAPKPTEAPAPTEAPPPAEKVSVRLMVMDYDENMKPDTQAVMDAFNASQDEVEATLDVVSWGQGHDLLVTQISGGQPPDLCNVSAQWGGEWEGIDEVMPLDGYVSKEFLAGFVPAMVAAFTNKDGQVMGLPYFLDPRPMYYRKDLFEAEGLTAPDTWDDVIAAGEALQNPPDMTGYGQTFSMKSDGLDYWWYAWFGAVGGDGDLSVWTDDGHNRFGTPEAIKATQYCVDLTQKYKITNTDYTTAGRDEELQPLFYAGKLAMLITGSWFPTLIANNAPDMVYDLGPPPVAEAGMAPATGVWPDSVLMFKQTKHPEAAGKLLEFMFTPKNRMDFAKQRGVIPELKVVGQDPAYAVSDTEKFMVSMLDYSHNVYETPWPATYYKTFVEVETQIGRAVAGEITAEEAMKSSAEYVDKENGL